MSFLFSQSPTAPDLQFSVTQLICFQLFSSTLFFLSCSCSFCPIFLHCIPCPSLETPLGLVVGDSCTCVHARTHIEEIKHQSDSKAEQNNLIEPVELQVQTGSSSFLSSNKQHRKWVMQVHPSFSPILSFGCATHFLCPLK